MAEAQLRLFPEPRPLLERFGAGFFRAAPARPGVYLMTGERLGARGSHFEEAFHMRDMALLSEFYARGPQRNAHLREVFCLPAARIAQSELDDLLALREQYANRVAPGDAVS